MKDVQPPSHAAGLLNFLQCTELLAWNRWHTNNGERENVFAISNNVPSTMPVLAYIIDGLRPLHLG